MKKITLFTSLILASAVFGQVKLSSDFDVSVGTPYQVVDAPYKNYYSDNQGNSISVKTRGDMVTIQKFSSSDMKETGRKEYPIFAKDHSLQKIVEIEGGLMYIYEVYNRKEKASFVYGRKIDYSDLSASREVELFKTDRQVTRGMLDNEGNQPLISGVSGFSAGGGITFGAGAAGVKFNVFQSFDKSKVLIQYRLTPESRKDAVNKDELGFCVLTSELEKMWDKTVMMPYTEKEMNNLAYTVASNGSVYMLAQLPEKKKFELIQITDDSGLKQFPLKVNGDLIFEKFELIEDAAGNISCAGFYANAIDFKMNWTGDASTSFNTEGIYSFKVSQSGTVTNEFKIPFSKEIINQNLSEKQREKMAKRDKDGEAGIPNLKMLEYYAQKDGSYIIVGEQRYLLKEFKGTEMKYVYHYKYIIVSKISAEGKLIWMKKIAKDQEAVKDSPTYFYSGQMSLRYLPTSTSHVLMFVDNPKNGDIKKDEVPDRHKDGAGGYITAVVIDDKTGDLERHNVAELDDIKGTRAHQFKITRVCSVEDNTFLMEAYIKGKKDATVKMVYKN